MAITITSQYGWTADQSDAQQVGTVVGGPIPHRRNGPKISGNGNDGMSGRIVVAASGGNSMTATWAIASDAGIVIQDLFFRAKILTSQSSFHHLYPFYTNNAYFRYRDNGSGIVKLIFFLQAEGIEYAFPTYTDAPYEWINLRLVTNKISSQHYDLEVMVRNSATGSWTTVVTKTNFALGATINAMTYGADTGGGASNTQSIVGRAFGTVAAAAAWSERYDNLPGTTFPTNQTDWYIDPVGGNDSNDGSSSSPWKTWSKLLSEDVNTFQTMALANRFAYKTDGTSFDPTAYHQKICGDYYYDGIIKHNCDRVIISYNSGVENVVDRTLVFTTPGLLVTGPDYASRPILTHLQAIAHGSWSLVAGKSKTYQATHSTTNRYAWQNRRALTPVFAGSSAAAATACEATAGTFWEDGAGLMYVHAFDDINLTTAPDGTIETSLIYGLGATLIDMGGRDQGVEYLDVGYTTLRTPNTALDAVGGYPIGFTSNGFKTCCFNVVHDGSKHIIGNIADSNGATFACMGNTVMGGAGWSGVSQTPFVDYCSQDSGNSFVNNRTYYRNNKVLFNAMKVGTAKYTTDYSQNAYICHSNGGGSAVPFSSICFMDEDYELAGNGIDFQLAVAELLFRNCRFNIMDCRNTAQFDGCTFKNLGNMRGIYNKCILTLPKRLYDQSNPNARFDNGNISVLNNCVLFLDGLANTIWFSNSHGMSLTVSGGAIFLPSGVSLSINTNSSDTLSFSGVRWILGDGASHVILQNHNSANKTLADLQTLGIDVGGSYVAPSTTSFVDECARLVTSGGRNSFFAN